MPASNQQFEFIEKAVFFGEKNGKVFGETLPEFQLCTIKNGLFAAQILTLSAETEKDINVLENIIAIKEGKLAWVGEKRDGLLSKAIENNLALLSKPERFMISVLDEYSEIVLDLIGSAENTFSLIEDNVLKSKTRHTMERIFYLKKKIMKIRQATRQYLRLANFISRGNRQIYQESATLYEKLLHFDELTDTYNELLSNMVDAHLTVISNKTNEIMKVLTIITTIAMPLTVISSFYGMNIRLPLQERESAVLVVVSAMALTVFVMLVVFALLGWFKRR